MLDYILDFYCHELKLAIEIDGTSHDFEKDRSRDKRLADYEVAVLRFDDKNVKLNIKEILNHIYYTIDKLSHPSNSPQGENSSLEGGQEGVTKLNTIK